MTHLDDPARPQSPGRWDTPALRGYTYASEKLAIRATHHDSGDYPPDFRAGTDVPRL
jgi:hypothetical protein